MTVGFRILDVRFRHLLRKMAKITCERPNPLFFSQSGKKWPLPASEEIASRQTEADRQRFARSLTSGMLSRFSDGTISRTSLAMIAQREDHDWTSDLAAEDAVLRESAVRDLRDMLLRGLAKSLSKHGRVDDAFLEDTVQDACLRILEKLNDFEGRSKFRTWAVTIAVRTAVSKMRKRDWQNVSLDSVTSSSEFDPQVAVDQSETIDQTNSRLEILGRLKDLIASELTERQWTAVTAELRGMPLPAIAEKLDTNTNSIYKLLHDARKKLRSGLEAAGFTVDELREAWA